MSAEPQRRAHEPDRNDHGHEAAAESNSCAIHRRRGSRDDLPRRVPAAHYEWPRWPRMRVQARVTRSSLASAARAICEPAWVSTCLSAR